MVFRRRVSLKALKYAVKIRNIKKTKSNLLFFRVAKSVQIFYKHSSLSSFIMCFSLPSIMWTYSVFLMYIFMYFLTLYNTTLYLVISDCSMCTITRRYVRFMSSLLYKWRTLMWSPSWNVWMCKLEVWVDGTLDLQYPGSVVPSINGTLNRPISSVHCNISTVELSVLSSC